MPTRETLHALVEALPEETWATVEQMLREYARHSGGENERLAAVAELRGMLAGTGLASDDFIRRKQAEIWWEDRPR